MGVRGLVLVIWVLISCGSIKSVIFVIVINTIRFCHKEMLVVKSTKFLCCIISLSRILGVVVLNIAV